MLGFSSKYLIHEFSANDRRRNSSMLFEGLFHSDVCDVGSVGRDYREPWVSVTGTSVCCPEKGDTGHGAQAK